MCQGQISGKLASRGNKQKKEVLLRNDLQEYVGGGDWLSLRMSAETPEYQDELEIAVSLPDPSPASVSDSRYSLYCAVSPIANITRASQEGCVFQIMRFCQLTAT